MTDPRTTLPVRLQEQLDDLNLRALEQAQEIRFLRQQRDHLQLEVERMQASRSWRLTAPLRALCRMLRELQSGARRGHAVDIGELGATAAGAVAADLPLELPDEESFVLYRIIGNDLPPRHRKGQVLDNLRFILEHEPVLERCEKRFVLNRILDVEQEQQAMELIESHGYSWIRIPFDLEEYRKMELDTGILPRADFLSSDEYRRMDEVVRLRFELALYRHKNNYVMNGNGARNAALADGRSRAKWIMPWDGNCFLPAEAWRKLRTDMASQSNKKYFVVPMARLLSNDVLVNGGAVPEPVEEPQLVFRADAAEQFNPAFCYGHRDKVELLWRLDVKGRWSSYHDDIWDQPRLPVSKDAPLVGRAGWVARLFSGMPKLEASTDLAALHRGMARSVAIMATLRRLDSM